MRIIELRRPPAAIERYRDDWFRRNIRIAVSDWIGPEPFSGLLWCRYYSEIRRESGAWYQFINAADLTLELLIDGRLHFRQNGLETEVSPGELYLIHKGSDCTFSTPKGSSFHKLRLMLCGRLIPILERELNLHSSNCIRLCDPESYFRRFREIGEGLRKQREEEGAAITGMIYTLLADLSTELRASTGRTQPGGLPARAIGLMKQRLGEKPSIPTLAAECGVGVHTLLRAFRHDLNCSPHTYWDRLRLERARELVGDSDLSFKEIAGQLGYCSGLYFSTVFRKAVGLSPSQFRRRCRSSYGE